MNIPKIEEAIILLYQTFIQDQKVATQRGIAITAMNEMVKLLDGEDVVKKIEAVPYSARLRTQHFFEDSSQRTWIGLTDEERLEVAKQTMLSGLDAFAKAIEAKIKDERQALLKSQSKI